MRTVTVDNQRRMSNVLDMALAASDQGCAATGGMDRRASAESRCDDRAWVRVSGPSLSLGGPHGLDTRGVSLMTGVDAAISDGIHLGVEAGAGKLDQQDGRNEVRNMHVGAYGFTSISTGVLSGTVDVLHSRYQFYRETGIGTAYAAPSGQTWSAGLQMAWPTALQHGYLAPKVGLLYQHQQMDGFQEQVNGTNPLASAFGITGAQTTANSLQPYASLAWSGQYSRGTVIWMPQLEAGYRYEARSHANPAANLMAQDGTAFHTPGTDTRRGMATLHAHISALLTHQWGVSLGYEGLFAHHLHDDTVSLEVTKHF